MPTQEQIIKEIAPSLEALGLFCFGSFVIEQSDLAHLPQDYDLIEKSGVLFGNRLENDQHVMWDVFVQSAEYKDGKPDSLNRWTERVVTSIIERAETQALFPFNEPIWPFQRWAMRATGEQSSPLGLLIHPEFGLWHAFRAVLIFEEQSAVQQVHKMIHVCDECLEKPCLSACPVGAFSDDGLDVNNCRSHLSSGNDPDCMSLGCRARAACPVGVPYKDEQIQFHMKAYNRGLKLIT